MKGQTLIEVIKELKESNLVPSKRKVKILANLSDKQVKLFLELKKDGFITKSNLNYATEMVSKIKEIGKIDAEALENLYYLGYEELNQQIFQFIVHELIADFNLGMEDIRKLSSRTSGYINIIECIHILKNRELSDTGLLNSILSIYCLIDDVHKFTYDEINFRIKGLNRVIEEPNVLKSFIKVENKQERRFSYSNMLYSFMELIDSKDMECFESALGMVSSLARGNQLNTKEIHRILSYLKDLDSSCFSYFEFILSKTEKWEYVQDIVKVFNKFGQFPNGANFAYLTEKIYDILMNRYNFTKDETDLFYFHLLTILNSASIDSSLDMKNINYFVLKLINSYCDFIKCAFVSGLDYLGDYTMISIKQQGMSDEIYDKLLGSFDSNLQPYQLRKKVEIYNFRSVRNVIMDDISVLRKLNTIMDEKDFVLTEGEMHLFNNPDFLKSAFFQHKYVPLVCRPTTLHGKNCARLEKGFSFLRDKSPAYQNNFFYLLGTFDFDDPNLSFYLHSVLDQIEAPEAINSLYEERLTDRENGALASIEHSLHEILSSNDAKQVEEYIKILGSASNMDLKANSKIIYQKKLGKKTD